MSQGATDQSMDTHSAAGVGARLKSAREAAGMTIDVAAQHLKLHPRQVKAIEDEDFGLLPGRTFARGFVRNYARLLNLDGDELIARLAAGNASALDSPELHSTGTRMAELPTAVARKGSAARWLIPLALIACIIAAGAYEWRRGNVSRDEDAARTARPAASQPSTAPTSATPASPKETLLPNPLTAPPPPSPAAPEAPPARTGGSAAPSSGDVSSPQRFAAVAMRADLAFA